MLAADAPDKQCAGKDRTLRAHILCAGNKTHQVCQKLWEQYKTTHQGITKALNVLKQPGMFQRFQDAMLKLVSNPGYVKIKTGVLCEPAIIYKQTTLGLFCPAARESRTAHFLIRNLALTLLSGDWRAAEHVRKLQTADWLHWQKHLHFVGFLMFCHGLFKTTLVVAFSSRTVEIEGGEDADLVLGARRGADRHEPDNSC